MPPYWGLGFHLCRWGYGSLNATIAVNDRMRMYGIPQDVQWNDIEYMRSRLDFTVDSTGWSGLGEFVDKLHNNFHQRYIPIVVSYGLNKTVTKLLPAHEDSRKFVELNNTPGPGFSLPDVERYPSDKFLFGGKILSVG